jgi:hypothetical protein
VDLRTLKVLVLERALNLSATAVLDDLRRTIDTTGIKPGLIVVDTFSKYAAGLDENDNAEVAAFLSALVTGLRDYYAATVLLVAHSGHGDSKRPRGASVLMANPDAEYIVQRPDPVELSCTVTRERYKDAPALPPLAYAAQVVDLGRRDGRGRAVTSLALHSTDVPPVADSARQTELRGKAQRQLLGALRANAVDGAGIWTLADIREIGRKGGMHKNTARAASEALTFTPHLIATVGGWRLSGA